MNFKKLNLYLSILLASVFIFSCHAKQSSENLISSQQKQVSDSLRYKIKKGKGIEKPVLVILMHGYGANEDDLMPISQNFPENYIVVTPQAPYKIGQNSYQWYTSERSKNNGLGGNAVEVKNSITKIVALIQSLQKKYNVPASRTFLDGFSQGANMSYQIALNNPNLMQGIIVMSGTIFDSLKAEKEKEKAGKFHIFIGHGDADNRIPYSEAVNSKKWLDERKYISEMHTYKGMSHSISSEEIQDILHFIQENLKK